MLQRLGRLDDVIVCPEIGILVAIHRVVKDLPRAERLFPLDHPCGMFVAVDDHHLRESRVNGREKAPAPVAVEADDVADVIQVGAFALLSVRDQETDLLQAEAQAERFLRQDLAHFEAYVDSLHVTSRQHCFDALVSFAFNVGCDALGGSTLLKKIRSAAPNAEIRAEFMRWVYATVGGKKKKLAGLVKRRAWEAARYFNEV